MKKILIILAIVMSIAVSAAAQSGTILGKLTYPSDGIPLNLVLCVKAAEGGQVFCSNSGSAVLREKGITFKVQPRYAKYVVTLPAGNYFIYATVSEMGNKKAYYDAFIKCGMTVECTSKKPILLKVRAGKKISGITVGDWYD